jgi:hypothetical protein
MSLSFRPLTLRLDADGCRALKHRPQARRLSRRGARQAIAETAERERRRSGLAAHPIGRVARVMSDVDIGAADWPE